MLIDNFIYYPNVERSRITEAYQLVDKSMKVLEKKGDLDQPFWELFSFTQELVTYTRNNCLAKNVIHNRILGSRLRLTEAMISYFSDHVFYAYQNRGTEDQKILKKIKQQLELAMLLIKYNFYSLKYESEDIGFRKPYKKKNI